MSGEQYCQISTTVDSRESADHLVRSAVEARLAACGQILGPVASVYWWEGAIDDTAEWLVFLKTVTDRSGELMDHIRSRHSHQVPEILVTPVTGGDSSYLAWIGAETRTVG